jgi:hypothetical protein
MSRGAAATGQPEHKGNGLYRDHGTSRNRAEAVSTGDEVEINRQVTMAAQAVPQGPQHLPMQDSSRKLTHAISDHQENTPREAANNDIGRGELPATSGHKVLPPAVDHTSSVRHPIGWSRRRRGAGVRGSRGGRPSG